jgi:two-component system chemotaxis response regulator CheY
LQDGRPIADVGDVTALVVENDAGIRPLIVRLIRTCGFSSVAEAGDGKEALAYLALHDPDLILTDMDMPRMNGIEFVRKLRAEGVKTPVIMMSAQDDETIIAQARQAGISAYVSKPMNAQTLSRTIHRTLALAARLSKRPTAGGAKARERRRGVA